VNIRIEIQAKISMQGHSAMDTPKQLISMHEYPYFYGYQSSIIHIVMDIRLDILAFLWISMHLLPMDSRSRGGKPYIA